MQRDRGIGVRESKKAHGHAKRSRVRVRDNAELAINRVMFMRRLALWD